MIPPDDLRPNPGEVTIPLVFQIPEGSAVGWPTGQEAKLLAYGGAAVAIVSTVLLVAIIWILGRYHNRAATRA
jgi:hypothetical protein